MRSATAVQRVLGLPPGAQSPFDLLNLPPTPCDRAAIDAALSRRLARVARHPLSRTPDGEEVRMALHAAAAQLRDGEVQSALLDARGAREAGVPAPIPTTPASAREQFRRILHFRETAARVIVLCGGWNARSRRMLAAVASAGGLTPMQMTDALRTLTGPAPGVLPPRAAPPPPPAPARTFYEELHAPAGRPRTIPPRVIFGAGAVLGAFGLVVLLTARLYTALLAPPPGAPGSTGAPDASDSAALSPPGASLRDAGPRAAAGDSAAPPAGDLALAPDTRAAPETPSGDAAAVAGDAPPPMTIPDPAGLVRALRQCVALSATDPGDAAWRLSGAIGTLSAAWASLEPATLDAAHDAIAEFVVRAAPGGESLRRALDSIAAGARAMGGAGPLEPHEVWSGAWSVGMLTRLSAEGSLPRATRDFVETALSGALREAPPSDRPAFWSGARAALLSMTEALASGASLATGSDSPEGPSAWERWILAVHRITVGRSARDTAERDAMHLSAVEALLLEGPALAQSPRAHAAMSRLLAGVAWIAPPGALTAPPAHARVIAWLEDSRLDTADLSVVTEWIVRSSGAPGVGITMALPRSASVEARAALRDRYALIWGAPAGAQGSELASLWLSRAADALRRPSNANSSLAALSRAATLSRLSEAAARRWRHESSAALIITRDASGPAERAVRSGAGGASGRPAVAGDGRWALSFLSAMAIAERLFAAVSEMEMRGGAVGPVDGDVLARAALLGAPAEVRSAAQRAVRRHALEPAVVSGLLEALPGAPRNEATRRLLEDVAGRALPRPDDAEYPLAARRALVEALLEMLAGRTELSTLDALADALADAYAGMLVEPAPGTTRAAPSSAALDAPDADEPDAPAGRPAARSDPDRAARDLSEAWRDEARRFIVPPTVPGPLSSLQGRRDGRAALARGPVQRFAAEQASAVEMMAYVVAAERPSRAADVAQTLEHLAHRRREAASVVQQIEAGEEAALTLWIIRFGEEPPPGSLANPAKAGAP